MFFTTALGSWRRGTLVADGHLGSEDFLSFDSLTTPDRVPIGSIKLDQFDATPPARRMEIATAVAAALPDDTIAHRLGDFVLTYHGIDLGSADANLWLVVWSPEPGANPVVRPDDEVAIGLAGGGVAWVKVSGGADALNEQNELRTRFSLPPLTNPFAVTHARPATIAGRSD